MNILDNKAVSDTETDSDIKDSRFYIFIWETAHKGRKYLNPIGLTICLSYSKHTNQILLVNICAALPSVSWSCGANLTCQIEIFLNLLNLFHLSIKGKAQKKPKSIWKVEVPSKKGRWLVKDLSITCCFSEEIQFWLFYSQTRFFFYFLVYSVVLKCNMQQSLLAFLTTE